MKDTKKDLKDNYDRTIDYLRISITDKCNLRCVYCMPEKGIKPFAQAEVLTDNEIVRFVRIARNYGLRKVRITGGEPLIRDRHTGAGTHDQWHQIIGARA